MKAIEKASPYEVAETSAVGRALGFAGYGIVGGIASADEMIASAIKTQPAAFSNATPISTTHSISAWEDKPASLKQKEAIMKISELTEKKLGFDDMKAWTAGQASNYIVAHGTGGYKKAKDALNF